MAGGWCIVLPMVLPNRMKDKELKYKGRCMKMHDDTWKLLQERKSGLSWNVFLLKLLGKEKPYAKRCG